MDLSYARTAKMAQLPAAFAHCDKMHPHSSLKMKSPREFRRGNLAELSWNNPAPHCQ